MKDKEFVIYYTCYLFIKAKTREEAIKMYESGKLPFGSYMDFDDKYEIEEVLNED